MARRKIQNLEAYPLFYEELARDRERTVEQAKKAAAYDRAMGLSEGDVAKLSDDLRRPMKDPSSDTNPLQ